MTKTFQADLEKRLEDGQFAEEYGSSIAKAEIAVTIAQARRSKGITQQELAEKLDKTQSYIAKLESGDANPTVGNIGKILAKMGLRLVAGINILGSNIENKEISVLSFDSSQTFFSFNSQGLLANEEIGYATPGTPFGSRYGSGSFITYQSVEGSIICVGTDYGAEDTTDVLWQASKEAKKNNVLELKGGSR